MTDFPVDRLFSYKLTHDTGFAPNPFRGVCTLATCKPRIRELKRVGDWIAGFTSSRLNHDAPGRERLVYLMMVEEKIRFQDYHDDRRFAVKIPTTGTGRCVDVVGDNIYGERHGAVFQLPNPFHTERDLERDTEGKFVLVARTFAYFGSEPLEIPEVVRPAVPSGIAGHGVRTAGARASDFVRFVLGRGVGVHAKPTSWPAGDSSWREE
jgi:hypothetical protein